MILNCWLSNHHLHLTLKKNLDIHKYPLPTQPVEFLQTLSMKKLSQRNENYYLDNFMSYGITQSEGLLKNTYTSNVKRHILDGLIFMHFEPSEYNLLKDQRTHPKL